MRGGGWGVFRIGEARSVEAVAHTRFRIACNSYPMFFDVSLILVVGFDVPASLIGMTIALMSWICSPCFFVVVNG